MIDAPLSFGDRIRTLRWQSDLDQATLAARVEGRLDNRRGFDVTYLSKIENGRVGPPSVPVLLALAAELGTEVDELLAQAERWLAGLGKLLRDSPGARAFWHEAASLDLGEEDWRHLLADIKRQRGGR